MATMEFYISHTVRNEIKIKLKKHFRDAILEKVEEGIYDYTHQYCANVDPTFYMATSIYKSVSNEIIFNFDDADNYTAIKIKKDIKNKTRDPYNIAFLKPEELNEDAWARIILRKNTTEDKLKNLPTMEWKPCKRCKCTSYSYLQLQIRSADEPITTFYICKECDRCYAVNA